MASPNGACSGSSSPHTNSGSDGDLQAVLDRKKRLRMLSNRESARRSRMRKQQQLDDLTAEACRLRRENHQIRNHLCVRTHHCLAVAAQNTVLRTQARELSSRLHSLHDILQYLCLRNAGGAAAPDTSFLDLPQPMILASQHALPY